jgi:hypothetical protein
MKSPVHCRRYPWNRGLAGAGGCVRLEAFHHESGTPLIHLQQDSEGFIRMKKHFPASTPVTITFSDGSQEEFKGSRLNGIYDEALAVYRAQNQLDAKGFSRGPKKKVQAGIEFVAIRPGMGQ